MFDIFRPYFAVEVVTNTFAQYGTESNHAFIVVHTFIERPLHIISANMHSVMNSLFAEKALAGEVKVKSRIELFELLSLPESEPLRKKVKDYAHKHGMISVDDTSGTNIDVQLFDTAKIDFSRLHLTKCITLRKTKNL